MKITYLLFFTEYYIMKTILTIAALTLVSATAMANSTSGVSTVLNGTIQVGTYVAAGLGQHETQTATGSLSAFTTKGTGEASYKEFTVVTPAVPNGQSQIVTEYPGAKDVPTTVVVSSITGNASESHSGNGIAGSMWNIGTALNPINVNSIVDVNAVTTLTKVSIPVTTLRSGEGSYSN
jgi:hypothetical protein